MAASRLITTRDKDGKPLFLDPESVGLVLTYYDKEAECDIARVVANPFTWVDMLYTDFLRDIGPYMKASRRA